MITLETKLAILQQCEYEWPRYQTWLRSNAQTSTVVHPKQWTLKLKLLAILAKILPLQLALQILEVPKQIIIRIQVFRATRKLRALQAKGLIVVAIAGSYAKTSTKFIAQHVLTASKNTVMSPENINTPIGLARFILDSLKVENEIFIAELGEYYPGDIASLVHFLSPDYKILTPVGYAHLERFGSPEALKAGLRELLTTDPKKGKTFVYGTDYDESKIENVSVTRAGTEFSYEDRAYFIPLFGRHNAVNVLPTVWLADQLSVEQSAVANALASLPFIPHRLEPTQLEQNILLLDNGYNSNPASARESLAVLHALDASQRIVSTPGFVEMGKAQVTENEQFGEEIAAVADICIVIKGINTDAIVRGLRKGGFSDQQIILADGEEAGMNLLHDRVKPSAVILFENSIPELYKRTL